MHQQNGENQIMTVPESQMRNFIAVAANIDEPVIFLSPEEVALSKGDKVRIKTAYSWVSKARSCG